MLHFFYSHLLCIYVAFVVGGDGDDDVFFFLFHLDVVGVCV